MRGGELRHIVTIDEPTSTQNDTGEEVPTWTPYGKTFAAVEPLRGRELATFEGIEATTDTRIRLRWTPKIDQISPKWRIRFRDVIYNIESIVNIDFRFREVEVLCSSGVNRG